MPGNRCSQIPDARYRRIVGCAFLQPLDTGLHNGTGSIEIRLADFEMNNTPALPFQFIGTPQHLECAFAMNTLHPLCDPAFRFQLHSGNSLSNEMTSKYNISER